MRSRTPQFTVVATTACAMALGSVSGFERELKQRACWLSHPMLVSGVAALLLGIGLLVLADPSVPALQRVQIDPLRLMEAVVAGVSFIGAGTIFGARGRDTVTGITTAASLLVAAVRQRGLAVLLLALFAAILTLLVLTAAKRLEKWLATKSANG